MIGRPGLSSVVIPPNRTPLDRHLTVGRQAMPGQLVLDHPNVSRCHAAFDVSGGTVVLRSILIDAPSRLPIRFTYSALREPKPTQLTRDPAGPPPIKCRPTYHNVRTARENRPPHAPDNVVLLGNYQCRQSRRGIVRMQDRQLSRRGSVPGEPSCQIPTY